MAIRQLFSFVTILATLLFTACGGEDIPTNNNNNDGTEEPVDPDKPKPESAFTIEISELSATGARVTVAAKDSKSKFYFDILREEYFNNYNDRLGFQNFFDNTVQGLMTSNSMSKEDVLSRILSSANDSYGFTGLEAGSVYYAVAMGVDEKSGLLTTDVEVEKFTTLEVEHSANTFDMSVGTSTYTGTSYSVKPSITNESYVLIAWNKKVVDQMSDTEFIDHCLKTRSDINDYVVTGNQTGVLDSCVPGREYYLVAFGYKDGVATTGVTKVPFTTKISDNVAGCSFSFEVSDIQYDRVYMKVTPTVKHAPFFWSVVEKQYLQNLSNDVGAHEAMKSILAESLAPFAHDFGNLYDALEFITSFDDVSVP